jgi:hypothetical protein
MSRNPAPGGCLKHPALLGALLVLVLNDHLLKRVCPGFLTGKLSDFAGVLLLPLFLHALCELFWAHVRHRPLSPPQGNRVLFACVVVSLIMFALPEVWKPAELAYRYGLGGLRWPFQALYAWLTASVIPALQPVRATADVTDLLALPMGFVAYRVGRRDGLACGQALG